MAGVCDVMDYQTWLLCFDWGKYQQLFKVSIGNSNASTRFVGLGVESADLRDALSLMVCFNSCLVYSFVC